MGLLEQGHLSELPAPGDRILWKIVSSGLQQQVEPAVQANPDSVLQAVDRNSTEENISGLQSSYRGEKSDQLFACQISKSFAKGLSSSASFCSILSNLSHAGKSVCTISTDL